MALFCPSFHSISAFRVRFYFYVFLNTLKVLSLAATPFNLKKLKRLSNHLRVCMCINAGHKKWVAYKLISKNTVFRRKIKVCIIIVNVLIYFNLSFRNFFFVMIWKNLNSINKLSLLLFFDKFLMHVLRSYTRPGNK